MSKFWSRPLILGLLCGATAAAQTQVNLSTQSKVANLSNEGPTKPIQTGTVLPAVCTTGQMFFLTTAAPGSNIFVCAATNIWTGIAGGGGGGAITAGTGIVLTQTGGSTTLSVDTALIPTKTVVQATTSNIATVTSTSSTALTATGNPTLFAYSDKQLVELSWNVACAGGAMTLSIDGLATVNIVKSDGVSTLGSTDCASGQTNLFSYDGTLLKFKLVAGGSSVAGASPYLQFAGNSYLDYSFKATPPPSSGWTPINFGSSSFNTTGANGAISIDAQSGGGLTNLRLQTVAIGSTSTLIAVVDGQGPITTSENLCGVGIYNSSNTNTYMLSQWWNNANSLVEESFYTSPTSKSFDGNQGYGGRGPLWLKLVYSGGTATSYYSMNGYKWTQINSRSESGFNFWVFGAHEQATLGANQGAVTCNLYSWSVQ